MTRRSREELRQLMIETGVELVRARGLAFDPPTLTYATVFHHLESTLGFRLHRSQVHGRIWPDQEAFRLEVIVKTILGSAPATTEVDALIDELSRVNEAGQPGIGQEHASEAEHSGGSMSEMQGLARRFALDSLEAAMDATRAASDATRAFDLFVAAQGLSTSGTATPPEVTEAVVANLVNWVNYNEQRFRRAASLLGEEPRPSVGLDIEDVFTVLARTAGALAEGERLLGAVDAGLSEDFHVSDLGGHERTLGIGTLGLMLIVEDLFELDPDTAEATAPHTAGPDTAGPDTADPETADPETTGAGPLSSEAEPPDDPEPGPDRTPPR